MTGADKSGRETALPIERTLLAALCQPSLGPDARSAIVQKLRNHRFAAPDHEVVFRAILTTPIGENTEMLAALTQAVTRMGFPDIELRDYVDKAPLSNEEILTLLAQL